MRYGDKINLCENGELNMKKGILTSFIILLVLILVPVTPKAALINNTIGLENAVGYGYSSLPRKIVNMSADINGDGRKEAISATFDVSPGYDDYDVCTVKINSSMYKVTGARLNTRIYLVDINKKDKYKEIAVVDNGMSDDYSTTFLYYNKKVQKVGSVYGAIGYGLFDRNGIGFNGSGMVTGESRGHLLQTWFYSDYYKLNSSHILQRQSQKYYKTLKPNVITAKKTITLYSDDKKKIVAKLNKGDKVTFIGSDEKQWCIVKMKSGKYGWFKAPIFSEDLFDGLFLAD